MTGGKTFQELTFTDNFMFCSVLRENKDLCKDLVELLLDIKIREIRLIESERTSVINPDIKSIRMDVYLDDADGTVFDLEMQNSQFGILPRRSRYYLGMIDADHLHSGAYYDKLPEVYVIFICRRDPFGKNYPVYEFRNVCVQDRQLELGDGAHKVFINADGDRTGLSDEMTAFLNYIQGKMPESELTMALDDRVAAMKTRLDKEKEYMALIDYIKDDIEEAEARGEAKGRKLERLGTLRELYDDGVITLEECAIRAEMSPEEFLSKTNQAVSN